MKRPVLAAIVLGLALLASAAEVTYAQAVDENGDPIPEEKPKSDPGKTVKIVISYLLALGGVAVVSIVVVETFQKNLSYPSAKLGLINLLRTSPNNAEMVCRSMPGTFYEPLAAAFKTAAMVGPMDIATIATATRPSYDGGAMAVNIKWKTAFGKAKLGAMAAAGGLALVATGGELPILIVILVVLVLVGLGWIYAHKSNVERTIVLARNEVLPEVERALASGRYSFPPPPAQ